MGHPVKGIDHCFVLTDDLDHAAESYAALGFQLSPRGLHSEAKGSANHTIMFPEDYLELLGLLRPTELNAARRESLARSGPGLHAIACRIDSAEDAATSLEALGFHTVGLGSFERPVPMPDGSSDVAAFSTVAFAPEESPLGTVFMCQHKTRHTVWVPELLEHPNTACGLDSFVVSSETPGPDAEKFARLWAQGRVVGHEAGFLVETGVKSAPLLVVTPASLAALYPGLDLSGLAKGVFSGVRIRVRDMDRLRSCLDASGVAATPTDRGLAVSPEKATGAIVEFVAP